MVALVLILRVEQRLAVGITFGLGLMPRLELGFWLRLGVVTEFTFVLGYELGIEAGCKLGLLVGTGTAGLGLASDSFIVAVVVADDDISVLWELLWSGLSGSKADLGLSLPITSLTVLLCMGRRGMFEIPVLSSNWLREVGAVLRVGETSESCVGAAWAGCLSRVLACCSKSGLGCWGAGKRGLAILGADNSLKG